MNQVEKLSLYELGKKSDSWKRAVVVFDEKSWDKEFSLESRSYEISSDSKYFDGDMIGSSLYGSALDGSDDGVRLDHYMVLPEKRWIVDYCYIIE